MKVFLLVCRLEGMIVAAPLIVYFLKKEHQDIHIYLNT